MKKNKWNGTVLFVFVFIITIVAVYWFIKSDYYPILNSWIQSNMILYAISLFIIKVIGILWPPISGGIFTLASIPFWDGKLLLQLI